MRVNLQSSRLRSLFLTMMLIVAMALTAAGCGSKTEVPNTEVSNTEVSNAEVPNTEVPNTEIPNAEVSNTESAQNPSDLTVLGEGETVFQFIAVDKDGNETNFEIHTDKETVGEALMEQNLIAGDEGEYGLYVKQVNGITADYDVDQTYWAFYVNGEYASSGVDSTPVKEGETYTFKIEK